MVIQTAFLCIPSRFILDINLKVIYRFRIEMGFRPQTLYAIEDSPVGLAAWLMDHDPASLELIQRSIDGVPEGLTPDDVLDNITLFWLTKTGISAARLYWELFQRGQGVSRREKRLHPRRVKDAKDIVRADCRFR